MILGALNCKNDYKSLSDNIIKVLDAAKGYTADNFKKGRVDIDGDSVYMNFAEYKTHTLSEGSAEAHRKYIDVMCMIEGRETIYVKNVDALKKVTKEYTPEIDALLADVDADATPVVLEKGSFIILFPQDTHAPGCISESSCNVKKIIGKVLVG